MNNVKCYAIPYTHHPWPEVLLTEDWDLPAVERIVGESFPDAAYRGLFEHASIKSQEIVPAGVIEPDTIVCYCYYDFTRGKNRVHGENVFWRDKQHALQDERIATYLRTVIPLADVLARGWVLEQLPDNTIKIDWT